MSFLKGHRATATSLGLFVAALFWSVTCQPLAAQEHNGQQLVTASLVADTTAIVPGKPFRLGLHLRMAPDWHVYWQNPGDAGLDTTFHLHLSEGFQVSPIAWPLPHRFVEAGDIQVYAYNEETLLIITVTPPPTLSDTVEIKANASWLVCKVSCIPGQADLAITLPVAAEASQANAELFAKYEALLPSSEPPPFDVQWTPTPTGWNLGLRKLPTEASRVEFFPYANDDVSPGPSAPREIVEGHADLSIPIAQSAPVRGVITLENGERRGWIVASTTASAEPRESLAPAAAAAAPATSFWTFLAFAFIGGFILNLMPCVLPVISLKIFGFMRQAGDSRASILKHGLAFIAGIFVWFLGLAAIVVGLKTAGSEVTWAFQFQNPWFNFTIGAIIFVFALNLFGVFEIVLPGRAASGLAEAADRSGLSGSFAQGILATLLATPCTAPFLGTALGFAFSRSPAVIFAIFTAVATGMGFPYILLSAKPGWMKYLPKPGLWMERLKQFMGFPLIATLLWLLYVIGQQRGTEAVIWALGAYLFLGLAVWLYGAFLGPLSSLRTKTLATLSILASLAVGLGYFAGQLFAATAATQPTKSATTSTDGIPWVPFSQNALDKLLAEGHAVFLDFTADWCITCKFNEKAAINTPAVREALKRLNIVPMKADWTNANPEITRKLAQFGRVGVPFYVFYPAGKSRDPIILPELLTEQIVLRALDATHP